MEKRTAGVPPAFQALENLLKEKSYATLTILNMIDWMGKDGKKLMPVVRSLKLDKYEARMQEILLAEEADRK